MRLLDHALSYLDRGFSIIPIRPDKKPFVKWEEYQKVKPTSEQVQEWWTRWPEAMIGIVTGAISGVVVIDVDKPDEGMKALSEYLMTSKVPTATTPRGGYHLYFKAPEKPLSNKAGTPPGCDFRGEGGYIIAPPSSNGTGKTYKWISGLSLEEVPPLPMPNTLINSLINAFKVCGEEKDRDTKRHEATRSDKILTLGRRDNDLFHAANALINARTPIEEVEQYLEILAENSNPPFPLLEISEKIKSALKRVERRERNISQEVREWVEATRGDFEATSSYKELHLATSSDMRTANKALCRLVDEGILERWGSKRGAYRRVDREYIKIDLQSASGKPLDMRWPFGIEKLYRPFPKNLITVMGTPDAGKSAFLFNVARMNMDKFKVHYFSSEMGADELWDRLANFGIPKEEWMKKCEMIERSSNFSDVIFADDLNIIDYLDMTGGEGKEFYKVGDFLEQIYQKLRNGIAIVGIQKDFGRDLGRGGLGTIERPRLSIAIESSRAKIVKCKNWVDKKFNPNHLELEYKLVDGCKFIIQKDWYKA